MSDAAAPSRPLLSLVEPERFGRYRLLAELGAGGMARIYLASFEGPGGFVKPCVIKKVRPEHLARDDYRTMFMDEARVAALLTHPNIVQAFDFGEVAGEHYLALEHVEGASLSELLRAGRKRGIGPSLSVTVHLGIALCEALAYAHAARSPEGQPLAIVHRDVNPANVLISRTGAIKLADFGVVKSSINEVNSKPGILKGKVTYLSPEQARGDPLDRRSDLFSLGLLLYELATGRCLLARSSVADSVRAAAAAQFPRPSTLAAVPPGLEAILMRALQRDRDERFPDAESMRSALEALRTDQRWGPASQELAALLEQLFPDGMPSVPRRLVPPPLPRIGLAAPAPPEPSFEPPELPPDLPVEVEVEMVLEPDDSGPRERPVYPWREVALLGAVGLAASAALWLFLLP